MTAIRDGETKRRRDEVAARVRTSSLRLSVSPSLLSSRCAFTLTEILIVIGLIVLLLALAMPAFNFITGGRSIDGALNQISAFIGRARAEAIGLQEMRGVMFFVDPATPDRVSMTLVKPTAARPGDDVNIDVYLDLVREYERLAEPAESRPTPSSHAQ